MVKEKAIYKIMDEKGRVLIPKGLRDKAELEQGDIVRLGINGGAVSIKKVDLIEVGSQDADMVEAYVSAAFKTMDREKQIEMAAKLLKLAGQKE